MGSVDYVHLLVTVSPLRGASSLLAPSSLPTLSHIALFVPFQSPCKIIQDTLMQVNSIEVIFYKINCSPVFILRFCNISEDAKFRIKEPILCGIPITSTLLGILLN